MSKRKKKPCRAARRLERRTRSAEKRREQAQAKATVHEEVEKIMYDVFGPTQEELALAYEQEVMRQLEEDLARIPATVQ